MKITSLALHNFKRFTNLSIQHIPAEAKLVLLIGSNGSGKSCVFDAFALLNSESRGQSTYPKQWLYYKKEPDQDTRIEFSDTQFDYALRSSKNGNPLGLSPTSFYGRTSFRQIPRLTRTALGQGGTVDFSNDSDRPTYFIDRDNRFENDVEKITEVLLREFFRGQGSAEEIRQKYIDPINGSLEHIFGSGNGTKLQLIEIIPPLEGNVAQITFRKGNSEMHYNYLSAGEKEVFNILINLLSRTPYYQDTVYYLDELDLHLNTKIQFNLLKEITENWIPDNCQLWTASHSLGFIEYARQAQCGVIVDFDDLDFDYVQTLRPESKDNPEIYDIAVGKAFLPALFQDYTLYFVENKDSEYYALLDMPRTLFISATNRNTVFHKIRSTAYKGIVDRDFLTDDDLHAIREHYPNLYVLDYYSIENYLYHPENLASYYTSANKNFDKEAYMQALTAVKNAAKTDLFLNVGLKRTEYPYFSEPEYNGTPLQNRFRNKGENEHQSKIIADYLSSDEFETYYKVLPMKKYATHLPERQHIPKHALAKTTWFWKCMNSLLQNKDLSK